MTFQKGDRVNVTALNEVGRIVGGENDKWQVRIDDGPSSTYTNKELSEPSLQKNMSDGGMDNIMEVGANAVVYAIVQKIRKSDMKKYLNP